MDMVIDYVKGTGNGLSQSLSLYDIKKSCLAIIHGFQMPMDIMKITSLSPPLNQPSTQSPATSSISSTSTTSHQEVKPVYSFLQVSYGIIADVDFGSEVYVG